MGSNTGRPGSHWYLPPPPSSPVHRCPLAQPDIERGSLPPLPKSTHQRVHNNSKMAVIRSRAASAERCPRPKSYRPLFRRYRSSHEKTEIFTISNVESQVFTPNHSRLPRGLNAGGQRPKRVSYHWTTAPLWRNKKDDHGWGGWTTSDMTWISVVWSRDDLDARNRKRRKKIIMVQNPTWHHRGLAWQGRRKSHSIHVPRLQRQPCRDRPSTVRDGWILWPLATTLAFPGHT